MKRILVIFSVFVAVLLFSGFTEVSAQPVELKITTVQLRQQQMGVGIDRLSKILQEKLNSLAFFSLAMLAKLPEWKALNITK